MSMKHIKTSDAVALVIAILLFLAVCIIGLQRQDRILGKCERYISIAECGSPNGLPFYIVDCHRGCA